MRLRSAACIAFLSLLLAPACSDSTGPGGPPRLRFGEEVAGELAAGGESVDFLLTVEEGTRFSIRLDAPGGVIVVRLFDRNEEQRAQFAGGADDVDGQPAWLAPMLVEEDETFRVHVEAAAPAGGAFRLLVTEARTEPETRPASIEIGELVEGETIAHSVDVDIFVLDATAGEEVNIFLQSLVPGLTAGLRGWVTAASPSGPHIVPGFFGAAPASGELSDAAHGRITFPETGRYHIQVAGWFTYGEPGFTGPYRLLLYPVNRAPETAPAALVPDDTVAVEAIDEVGDVDEFTLSGPAGASYVLFADAGGAAPHGVKVSIEPQLPWPDEIGVTALAGGPTLRRSASGYVVLPGTGRVTVRVEGVRSGGGRYRGPYRLLAHRVNPAPESGSATPGIDAAIAGAVDIVGDVDEYLFDVAADSLFHVTLTRPAGTIGGLLQAELWRDGSPTRLAYVSAVPLPDPAASSVASTSRRRLEPGRYRLRVSGGSARADGFEGAYGVVFGHVRALPENVPGTIAIGDTVEGEAISPATDFDVFRFTATTADTLHVVLLLPTPTWSPGLAVFLRDADGTALASTALEWNTEEPTNPQSGRIVLPRSGTYELHVTGWQEGSDQSQQGPYAIALERSSAAPEHRAASVAFGDTVSDERIDVLGDIDDFVLRAPPGTELTAGFHWQGYALGSMSLALLDRAAGTVLRNQRSAMMLQYTGRVTMPASGELTLRVSECLYHDCVGSDYLTGPYRVVVHSVNRAPEVNAPSIAVGDTVTGDAIDFPGDIDEFTFSGTAGARVDVHFRTPFGICCFEGLAVELLAAGTGQSLGRFVSTNPTEAIGDQGLRDIVLPTTGTYTLRVESGGDPWGEGVYELLVTPSS